MFKTQPVIRNIIIITAYLFLTAAFFFAGYTIGFKNGGGLLRDNIPAASAAVPSAAQTMQPLIVSPVYRVILEDGQLRLYLDENGTSRLISNEEISESAFPSHDIASLKEGMKFSRLDDALSLMENFLS